MYYDEDKAIRVKDFIERLVLTAGEWAGNKFKLLDWQWKDVIAPLFGNLQYEGGPRQYRYCYVEIPKKNGKTELSAAIALYMLSADGENTPEVYSAAADREQASLVFKPAAYMVRHNKTLFRNMKILDAGKRIINHRNYGFYKVLASDEKTIHGINPSCIIVDELHALPNDRLWTVLTSGTDYARAQQLIFVMTTAGIYDKESLWWRVRERARQIKAGVIEDDTFLPVLYIADPEKDDPEDEKVWIRVNPSLNQIFDLNRIRKDHKIAKQDPVDYQNFLRFRLNIPIKQLERWMPMDKWDDCDGSFDLKQLEGKTCCGGLDLSSKLDLTAFVLVFPPIGKLDKYIILVKFYVPEDTIMERSRQDKVHYDIWVKEGLITATPGNVIDNKFIEKDIIKADKDYDLVEVGYDPWGATDLATRLYNDHNITMTELRQGTKTLSEPAKDILVKTMEGKISHGGNKVLRWCTDNLVMVPDANENIRPAKDKATDRIDGFVALIMAWKLAMQSEESPYNDRDLLIL